MGTTDVPATAPYPRVAAYLAPLPAGVDSHPQCRARAALLRQALHDRPLSREQLAGLPPTVERVVTCPPLDGEWVPDVWLMCVILAIGDAHGMDDEGYLSWMRDLNARIFGRFFRLLMKVASPEFIVRRAAQRWTVFHVGSALAILDRAPGRCTAELTFPPWLFHGLALRQFAAIFEAALQMSDPTGSVRLLEADERSARFAVQWEA